MSERRNIFDAEHPKQEYEQQQVVERCESMISALDEHFNKVEGQCELRHNHTGLHCLTKNEWGPREKVYWGDGDNE